jgi:hypothetical protein
MHALLDKTVIIAVTLRPLGVCALATIDAVTCDAAIDVIAIVDVSPTVVIVVDAADTRVVLVVVIVVVIVVRFALLIALRQLALDCCVLVHSPHAGLIALQ